MLKYSKLDFWFLVELEIREISFWMRLAKQQRNMFYIYPYQKVPSGGFKMIEQSVAFHNR